VRLERLDVGGVGPCVEFRISRQVWIARAVAIIVAVLAGAGSVVVAVSVADSIPRDSTDDLGIWNVLLGCGAGTPLAAAAAFLISRVARRFDDASRAEIASDFTWTLVIPSLLVTGFLALMAGSGGSDNPTVADLLDEWALVVVPLCAGIASFLVFTREGPR
jgi:hypothetical protein